MRDFLDRKESRRGVPSWVKDIIQADLEWTANYDRWERYLSQGELLEKSGLSREDLAWLEVARLLIPNTKDGRY